MVRVTRTRKESLLCFAEECCEGSTSGGLRTDLTIVVHGVGAFCAYITPGCMSGPFSGGRAWKAATLVVH